jgi:hypothetical protein
VIKQGPNRRPNLKSTKLLTRDASFPPESKKTRWFPLLFQARLAKKVPLHIVRKCPVQMFCSRAWGYLEQVSSKAVRASSVRLRRIMAPHCVVKFCLRRHLQFVRLPCEPEPIPVSVSLGPFRSPGSGVGPERVTGPARDGAQTVHHS